jgi:hypothetical protein
MSIFDNENNLPGVITEVEADYSYGYDTSLFGTTDSELVIGTAFDGPVGVPTPVYSPEHAAYVFGAPYDSTKKQEATLTAGVQDAWDRGCRTIYAVRVGGKDLYKDFNFCVDNGFKLRVSSMFPSNTGKEVYMYYDNSKGAEKVSFYKPASRATIAEKKSGLVTSSNAVLVTELKLAEDRSINYDSKLVDMINLVNSDAYNNVIKLSIVNADGVDVTNSMEAYEIPLGVMYPGAYFIGRNANAKGLTEKTETQFCLLENGVTKPYSDFTDAYFRKLIINTDVTQNLPIYAAKADDLRTILRDVSITMIKPYDFLKQSGISDRAWIPDFVDYEETNLSSFELYKRLGCGYAVTARAERRLDSNNNELSPRIRETPTEDTANRIQAIEDGIYSVLQDAEIRYRALTCAYADQKISGKLPRATDFQKAIAKEVEVLSVDATSQTKAIVLTPKVDAAERVNAKAYEVSFKDISKDTNKTVAVSDIYTNAVFEVIGAVAKAADLAKANFAAGTKVLVEDTNEFKHFTTSGLVDLDAKTLAGKSFIVKGTDGKNALYTVDAAGIVSKPADVMSTKVVDVDATKANQDKENADAAAATPPRTPKTVDKVMKTVNAKFVLGSILDNVFVYASGAGNELTPVGDFENVTKDDNEKTVVFAENLPTGVNKVVIGSTVFVNTTLEELVELLNTNVITSKLFTAAMSNDGAVEKDEFVENTNGKFPQVYTEKFSLAADRSIGYDYSLYIPYRTTDNFARQLAQHCTYTELKTTPTFGFIGCQRMTNVGLKSVSDKVTDLLEMDFDLYAKTNSGRDILDRQNRPYPIGKNVSIVFAQYAVPMTDYNYTYSATGAAGYAGMVSTLPLDQSSTAQAIAIDSTNFSLTQYQLGKLTSKGIVTMRKSFSKGIVVTDGITMAPSDSVYRRLSCSRIVGSIEELIRAAAEPFIGKQNHTANRNALHTAIKSKLDKIVGTLVEKYNFTMNTDTRIEKFNYIDITYQIVPIYEIREIRNTIQVKDNLTV